MNETEKLIEDQFKRLPAILQKALNAVPWKALLKEIPLLNQLSVQQVTDLERETMFIIYGFENSDDYIANIIRETNLDEETATTLAEAVNEKVFKPISLKIEELEKQESSISNNFAPETPPANLPVVEPDFAQGSVMVKKGEVMHDVASITSEVKSKEQEVPPARQDLAGSHEQQKVSLPDYRYDGGKDPYREPLK